MHQYKKQENSGQITAKTLQHLATLAKPGVSLLSLEQTADKIIRKLGGVPAFKNYNGYQFATCLSVNDVIVHGQPSDYHLMPGDILKIDTGANYQGWLSDAAITVVIESTTPEIQKLITAAKEALSTGIAQAKVNMRTGAIGNAIESIARRYNVGIAEGLSGHGIGKKLHESPSILNTGTINEGPILKNNTLIAIEPMFSLLIDDTEKQISHIKNLADNWGIAMQNGSTGVHFEHTIRISDNEPQILTKPVDTTGFVW